MSKVLEMKAVSVEKHGVDSRLFRKDRRASLLEGQILEELRMIQYNLNM